MPKGNQNDFALFRWEDEGGSTVSENDLTERWLKPGSAARYKVAAYRSKTRSVKNADRFARGNFGHA